MLDVTWFAAVAPRSRSFFALARLCVHAMFHVRFGTIARGMSVLHAATLASLPVCVCLLLIGSCAHPSSPLSVVLVCLFVCWFACLLAGLFVDYCPCVLTILCKAASDDASLGHDEA